MVAWLTFWYLRAHASKARVEFHLVTMSRRSSRWSMFNSSTQCALNKSSSWGLWWMLTIKVRSCSKKIKV